MRYSAILGAFMIAALAGTGAVLGAVQQCPPLILSYVTNPQVYRPCLQQPTLLQDRGYVDQRLNARNQFLDNGCGSCPSDDLLDQSPYRLDGTLDCQTYQPNANIAGPNIITNYVPQMRLPNGSCAPVYPASAARRSAMTDPVARRPALASATRVDVPSVKALRVPQVQIDLDKLAPVQIDPMRAAMPIHIAVPERRTEPSHVDPWFNQNVPQWSPPATSQSRPMPAAPPARPSRPPN